MARRAGNRHDQRSGRSTPHPTGERVADDSVPREDKAEPASGPRRDPLPTEYKNDGSDLPGMRKKLF